MFFTKDDDCIVCDPKGEYLKRNSKEKGACQNMKLKDLVDMLEPEADVTFEILGEIETMGCLAKELLESFEYASNYEVSKLGVGYYVEHGEVIPTFIVEVVQENNYVVLGIK
ncbi:hypothetical protein IHP33_04055 [Enterococcus faecalis]|uniref:hypothetical protein n=1 Tax=Enterococcus faecalis TaxID=1351 RepID=UPI00177DBED6|nr:hypothetical protein [Enterococcus faecalis]MBD9844892.1 hypothetical protein [Enterococcus faecalis]